MSDYDIQAMDDLIAGGIHEQQSLYVELDKLRTENTALKAENEHLTNLLENVVNELDLSDIAIEKHGQLGTEPAYLVELVLAEKDMKISCLKHGMKGE